MSNKLPLSFYTRNEVTTIAKELLGKHLITRINGMHTAGIIVETEAYEGVGDRASHAYGGRRTQRTEVMYQQGGKAYVYLCYGIHHLFNVVTNVEDIPHAILIRALEPVKGIPYMLKRTKKEKLDRTLTGGPGSLSLAFGIHHRQHSGVSLLGSTIWIEDAGITVPDKAIVSGTRVGVAYAREDAYRPYRFYIKDNPWVSKGKGI